MEYEPFSRFGSYLAIGRETEGDDFDLPLGPGYYIRSHHARGVIRRELFLLQGLDSAAGAHEDARPQPRRLELAGDADATEVRFRPAGHDGSRAGDAPVVRICFDEHGNLRLRGSGMGLRLTTPVGPGVVAYSEGERLVTVNARLAIRRYQFECLAGSIRLNTSWEGVTSGHASVDLLPNEEGVFECALDEFWSTWARPESRGAYEQVRDAASSAFGDFLSAFGDAPADNELSEAWERAVYVLWSTVVRPEGILGRPTMFMSKNWMDQVWSWDNCFNAQALAGAHDELAWDQWFVVFDHQDEFGAIPDGLNDMFKHYNFCKPPVHGWSVRELINRSSTRPPKDALLFAYRALAAHTDWFLSRRRRPGDALPYYLHGNDSGWDNGTMFDDGVPLIAPDLAALLIAQCDALADLGDELGVHADAALPGPTVWRERSKVLLAGLLDLWDGSRFVPQRIVAGKGVVPVSTRSLIPVIPIFLGRALPEDVRAALVRSVRELVTDHGIATEPLDSPHYEPDGYWRGPVWAPSTYLVVEGLLDCGEHDLARTIAERFSRTCARNGMAENFNAVTGEGLRDRCYSWTSSVFLLLARRFFRGDADG
jgi:hypothetical protein